MMPNTVFFMWAGFSESSWWAMLFWKGDQMVSWQVNDGIKSSVVALLSGCFSGFPFNHSDTSEVFFQVIQFHPEENRLTGLSILKEIDSENLVITESDQNDGYSFRMFTEAMISGFVENNCFMEIVELCQDMHRVGMAMDGVTLRVVAGVAAILGEFAPCRNIHVYALKVGLGRGCFVVSELIKSAARAGYHSNGCQGDAVRLAEDLSLGLNLREADLVCHIKEKVQQIYADTFRIGNFSYTNVCNALISIYSEIGSLIHVDSFAPRDGGPTKVPDLVEGMVYTHTEDREMV
ncbi:hypothetical protein ABZP36_006639 [Zizania latifolia]